MIELARKKGGRGAWEIGRLFLPFLPFLPFSFSFYLFISLYSFYFSYFLYSVFSRLLLHLNFGVNSGVIHRLGIIISRDFGH